MDASLLKQEVIRKHLLCCSSSAFSNLSQSQVEARLIVSLTTGQDLKDYKRSYNSKGHLFCYQSSPQEPLVRHMSLVESGLSNAQWRGLQLTLKAVPCGAESKRIIEQSCKTVQKQAFVLSDQHIFIGYLKNRWYQCSPLNSNPQ
jgi:hypothetical protein